MAIAGQIARLSRSSFPLRSSHGSPSPSPSSSATATAAATAAATATATATAAEMHKEILALCQRGHISSALQLLPLSPSPLPDNLCIFLLKSCIKKKALHHVRQVFDHISSRKGPRPGGGGALADYSIIAFAKCGGMKDASEAFRAMAEPTLFAWSAMVSGYASSGRGQEAIEMYRLMRENNFDPDAHVYVSLFKACGAVPDLDMGKALHAEVKRRGLVPNVFVGNSIVSMYGKCGCIREAELVFSEMCERNVVSWNAMLSGYVEQGDAEKVLLLYRQMREEEDGIDPNELSFVMAIQACCLLRDAIPEQGRNGRSCLLLLGRALHADAHRKGFLSHLVVASALMCMYGKLGDVGSVEGVFARRFEHNVVTWTTLLKAYIHQGDGAKALWMYREMLEEEVSLDEKALVLFFQACAILADEEAIAIVEGRPMKIRSLEIGRALHSDAKRKGLDSGTFVGGSVLHMYGKCGSIGDAEDVFAALPQQDVVSWNVMVSAYVDQGYGDRALHLYRRMLEAGVVADERSVVSTLQACVACLEACEECESVYVEIGRNLHSDACRDGLASNSFVGNTLINLYGKCRCLLLDAEHVFRSSSRCNVAAWNVMLSAYLEQGRGDRCLLLYRQMREEGHVEPDERTFVIALQACIDGREECCISREIVSALHADARKEGLASHVFVGNSLMTLYAKAGAIERAEHVFGALASRRNVVSWNVMLSAYVERGQAGQALLLYARMHEEGKAPDPQTFASVFQACSMPKEDSAGMKKDCLNQLPLVVIGRALHSDARRRGFASHLFVGNSVLSMYGRFGELAEARAAFDELHQPTVVSWNALLSSYVEHGKGDEALALYRRMQGEGEEGEEGVLPNDVTLVCALQAAGDAGARELCYQIHFAALSSGSDSSCFVATTLIHAYGNSANAADSDSVFCQMLCPRVEPWNARLTAFAAEADHAATTTSLGAFEEMIRTGIRPSKVSIFALLCACSYAGLVETGLECFVAMSAGDLGFAPELKHYVIAVDVLGRAGDFGKVEKLLSEMPLQPDLALWLCLLGACRIHGDVELGEHAYDRALRLQPDEPALYVSMSNIYARW